MLTLASVLGPVACDEPGTILAAEWLLRVPRPSRGNAGRPASEAEFARRAVDISMLGRLMMGADNLDDRTLRVADAEAALRAFAAASGAARGSDDDTRGVVVALSATPGSGDVAPDPGALAALSRATGVTVIGGTNGAGARVESSDLAGGVRAAILADLRVGSPEPESSVGRSGVVGLVSIGDEAVLTAAAEAASEAGVALVLAPSAEIGALECALHRVASAGLDRSRVIVTGATGVIAGSAVVSGAPSAPRIGVDESALHALFDLGVNVCFDDLGRIPNVRTVVSDHEVALAVLRSAARGAGDRILLSSGIREKHRLSAFGGNGLEFVPQQFLPYLRMCGAEDDLVRAVGGGNAARVLAIAPTAGGPADTPPAETALGEGRTV